MLDREKILLENISPIKKFEKFSQIKLSEEWTKNTC